MNKILYILSFILVIASISILSYKVVSASTEVQQTKDIIDSQIEKEKYLTPYGYTLDNPNIIINPYGNSPLTALILFETPQDSEITVMIEEKDQTIKIQNTFKSNTKHYIPIYGLYPNYNNKVIIKSGDITKKYTLTTTSLPADLKTESIINLTNEFTFINTNGYIYALDSNNEIRWYLTDQYKYNINKLSNGNFLLPTSNLNNNQEPLGIIEIDLLGKVYKQYNIENGYYGSFIEKENTYLILSKNIIEIDKQTGQTLNEIPLTEKYDNLTLKNDTNTLKVINNSETLSIDLKTYKKVYNTTKNPISPQELTSPLYTTNNYIITQGIKFKTDEITKESNKNILLIGYKKTDKNYQSHNIKIYKENEYLKISGIFNNEEVYLILDKFLDKRIYDIKNTNNLISTQSLKGKYSIYLQINGVIYKTDKYIKIRGD